MADRTSDRFLVTQALIAWVRLVLDLRKEQVLDSPFPATRPNMAYCIIERIVSRSVSEPWAETSVNEDDPTQIDVLGVVMKQDLFQIRCYGEDTTDWPERLERSRNNARQDVLTIFEEHGCSVYATDVLDTRDIVRDRAKWELGSILEVRVSYFSVDSAASSAGPIVAEVDVANNPDPLYDVTVEGGS